MSPPHPSPPFPTNAYEDYWAAVEADPVDAEPPPRAPTAPPANAYAEFLALDDV